LANLSGIISTNEETIFLGHLMDNLIIASMAGNFINANFLELRQYSYYVMSKIVFFIPYIFLDLLYLIVFFQTSLPNFNIYTSSLAIWETCQNLKKPSYTTQKGSTVQHSPCLLIWLPSPLYLDYLERDQNMQDQSIWLSDLPQYLEKNICFMKTQFESPTILPDWELPQTF
jgi:hypothetical protein